MMFPKESSSRFEPSGTGYIATEYSRAHDTRPQLSPKGLNLRIAESGEEPPALMSHHARYRCLPEARTRSMKSAERFILAGNLRIPLL